MDVIHMALDACALVFTPLSLILLFTGVMFGTLLGALPGLGSILALTVCLPFTLMLDHIPAFALMLGTYVGALYGGSIASILINVPGTPQAAATQLDGYPMALAGKADVALGWVTISAVTGGIFSCFVLAAAAAPLAYLSNQYAGPLEICALIAMGLTCIVTLSEGNLVKGLFSGLFGVILSCVGMDSISSELRFTFGFASAASGIDMLPFVVGLFPLSEVLHRIYEIYTLPEYVVIKCNKIRFPSLRDWFAQKWITVRSAVIGTIIGILPGTGASPAAFISYSVARESSKHPEEFGKGCVEGVIAPEASHNAVTGGAMVPTLALGIPGDAETTLILATLTIHQITPGVRLMMDNPVMVHSVFFLLLLAYFMLSVAAIIMVRSFGRLIRLPNAVLLGLIVIFSMLGAFITRNNYFDLFIALAVGIVAFGFRLGNFPLAPALVSFILAPQFEYRYSQVVIYRADTPWPVYLADHPLACIFLAVVLFLLIRPIVKSVRQWKAHLAQKDAP